MTKEDSERKKAYDNAYKQVKPGGPATIIVGDSDTVFLNSYRSSIRGEYKLPSKKVLKSYINRKTGPKIKSPITEE